MNVLVTGGAGYLGSVLVPKLLDKGYHVTVFDILLFGGESLVPHLNNKRFSLIQGDIRDHKLLKNVFRKQNYDSVVHLAALVGELACKIHPSVTEHINHVATLVLARLAKKSGVKRFLFTSTCSNYGVSDPDEFADETSSLHPLSLYADTKVAAEQELLTLNDKYFTVCVARLATIFGLSAKMRFNLLINEMTRDAFFGKTIVVYKEHTWRPYVHIQDAADALMLFLETNRNKISGDIFNAGTENMRKKDIIMLLRKSINKIHVRKEGGLSDNRDYRVSFEKVRKKLHFVPQKSVLQGIEEMLWALKRNLFFNPYDDKYSSWLNEDLLLKKT